MQQLLYVALSLEISLEALILTTATKEFSFYHGHGLTAPSIKEEQDEYLILANLYVPSIIRYIKRLFDELTNDSDGRRSAIVIVNVNAQSLEVNAEDIST